MKIKAHFISPIIDELQIPNEERSKILTVCLARMAAYELELPSGKLADNPYEVFDSTHSQALEATFAQVNESYVVDIDAAMDLARRLWVARYRVAYDAHSIGPRQFLTALARVGGREFTAEISETLIACENSEITEKLADRLDHLIVRAG